MMISAGAAALLLVVSAVEPQDRYARPDPFDSSVRVLRDAVRAPTSGTRNPTLLALIETKDPELRPLFQSLVQRQDRPVMQADAVLGLAMLDPRGTVDPFTIRQIANVELRSEVLKTLIGRNLLKAPEISQILLWPDELLPEDRLFLVATLERQHEPWQPSALEPIAETKSAELRALYSLLLLEKGQPESWEEFRGEIAKMTPQDRATLLAVLAPAALSYQLESSAAPLLRIAADRDIDPGVRAAIIGTALELDPSLGVTALRDEVLQDRSPQNLLRYSLLLMVVSEKAGIDQSAFALFDDAKSNEIAALVAAGRCANGDASPPAADSGCAEAFTRVIDLGLRPAAEWCMSRASALAATQPELARKVMDHVLSLAMQARDPREPILLLAVRASRALITLAPDDLRTRLLAPSVPTPILESIMLSLVDSASPEAAELAAEVRGQLPRRFDSMALVAMARGGRTLSAPEIEQLGVIAAGGGRVDEAIQVQAAWLYVKALGRHRDALARLSPE